LRYPEVFGKLMIFSPSLWVKPDMKINIADESLEDTKIYYMPVAMKAKR
jgi:predicted alpha/beta superfamily hydrolase